MGTLGEKQDKPIYAKASPPRFGFYWQQCHHGNEREPHQLEPYTMQLDILAMLPPHEPTLCRYASHESRARWQHLHRPQCTAWSTFHAQQPQPGAPTGNNAR